MNYLQYLQEGDPVTTKEMQRYFIPSIGNSGNYRFYNEFTDVYENIKRIIDNFKKDRSISTENQSGYIININGVPTIVYADGTSRPLDTSKYILNSTGYSGTVLVPKPKS